MSDKEKTIEGVSIPSPELQSQPAGLQPVGEGLGSIQCDKSVFKKLAGRAAAKVDGVASIGGRSTLGEIFLFREKDPGIEITTSPETFGICVAVTVNVFFDRNIYEVSTELQRSIKNAIETITNYSVDSVDIKVQDMEAMPPETDEVDEAKDEE